MWWWSAARQRGSIHERAPVIFAGRVAIVTGGTRGIGAAITRRLVEQGAHVTAVYNGNHDAASAVVASLAHAPGSVAVHCADIASAAACDAVVSGTLAAH